MLGIFLGGEGSSVSLFPGTARILIFLFRTVQKEPKSFKRVEAGYKKQQSDDIEVTGGWLKLVFSVAGR